MFAYQGLSWSRVQTVNVSGILGSGICAHSKLFSLSEYSGFIRHDFKTNNQRSVLSTSANILLNDNIGNVLLRIGRPNCLAVLMPDDPVNGIYPDLEDVLKLEDIELIGATLDIEGHLFVLIDDMSVCQLRQELKGVYEIVVDPYVKKSNLQIV